MEVMTYPTEPNVNGGQCTWQGAKYGSLIQCPTGWIMEGIFGSGYRSDCPNSAYYMIKCCDADETYPVSGCSFVTSKYGVTASCPNNQAAYGGCGSGRSADCKNTNQGSNYNELYCCNKDNIQLAETNCYSVYGDFGEQIDCASGYAVTEMCGSGMYADCSGST